MASLKRKRLSLSGRYKAIGVESGRKLSKVAEKYGDPRNTISIWLLAGNKEKIKSVFQSGEVNFFSFQCIKLSKQHFSSFSNPFWKLRI